MPDTPLGWRERAVDNLIHEAEHTDELAKEMMQKARNTPKLAVGPDGIKHPRRELKSLAMYYRESSEFYRHYAQVLRSGNA